MKSLYICIFLLSTPLLAKEVYDLHWGINLEPLDFYIPAAGRFKKRVERRSNGKINVKLSIGHYKQSDRDHLKDVRDGVYDMGQETLNNLQRYAPSLEVWDLPFLFQTNKQVFAYTETSHAKKAYEYLKNQGVVGIEYTYSGGFLHMYGNKINSFDDLRGKVVAHEDYSKAYKKFVNSTYNIIFKNYEGSGSSAKNSEIIASTLYELNDLSHLDQIYLNRTEHRLFARILFLSQKFLKKLPKNLRKIVLEEVKAAGIYEREMAVKAVEVYIKELQKKGIKLNVWSKKQKIKGRFGFKSMYDTFEKKFGVDTIKEIDKLPN